MMLPMSIHCATCGNYIYKGTKFNSRKEDVIGQTYLGIKIFRFNFKCTKCSAEITYKTDPRNPDYSVESGAIRNFEPWRGEHEEMEKEKEKQMRDAEENGDSMKSLENRTLDTKRQIDIDVNSDELRQASVSIDAMLEDNVQRRLDDKKAEELEDETLVRSVLFRGSRDKIVKRIRDEGLEEDDNNSDDLDFEISANKSVKRSKFFEEKPTDLLTKASIIDSSNNSGIVKLSLAEAQAKGRKAH